MTYVIRDYTIPNKAYLLTYLCCITLVQIERYSVLASLYDQLQMCRKAAFFRRIAAMQCVQDGARTAWQQCYNLLLQAYGGYNMSVDPKVFPHGQS